MSFTGTTALCADTEKPMPTSTTFMHYTRCARQALQCGFYAICVLMALASSASAQQFAPTGVVTRVITPPANQPLQVQKDAGANISALHAYEVPIRIVMGAGGSLLGAYVGAGLAQELGAAVGSIATAAFLSAAPLLGNNCSFAKRIGTGVFVGAAGAVIGGVIGLATSDNVPVVLGYVAGAGLGSGVGSALCRG